MKTPGYEYLEQWISQNRYELQLRPGKFLAISVPKGIVAEGDTLQELISNIDKLGESDLSPEELTQPCFIVRPQAGGERGQA